MPRIIIVISFAVLANLALAHALRQHGAVMPGRVELATERRKTFPPEPSLN